jgi:hypothetical protein
LLTRRLRHLQFQPTSRHHLYVCERELFYVAFFIAATGNAGWHWHLVPIKLKSESLVGIPTDGLKFGREAPIPVREMAMTQVNVLDAARADAGGYKVAMSHGERISRVSSEWFSRPADELHLSLSEPFAAVRGRAGRSRCGAVESAGIRLDANCDNAERLALMPPGEHVPLVPTHWSFGQLASLVGAPAAYLRQLPAPAGINLQDGLTSHRAELVRTLEVDNGRVEPLRTPGRAITTASSIPELTSESPVQSGGEESMAIGGETAVVDFKISTEDKAAAIDPQTIAAE